MNQRIARRCLSLAAAIFAGGCATPPNNPPASPADLVIAVIGTIDREYLREPDLYALANACLRSIGENKALEAPADPAVDRRAVLAKDLRAALATKTIAQIDDQCLPAMVAQLDMRGAFLGLSNYGIYRNVYKDFDDWKNFKDDREEGATGLIVKRVGEKLIVLGAYDKSPAQRSTIRRGDELLKVNGVVIPSRRSNLVIWDMYGPNGTTASVEIRRAGREAIETVSLTRELVETPQSFARVISDNVLYLAVGTANKPAMDRLGEQVKALREKSGKPFSGVVLDLRWMSGGEVRNVVELASFFLERRAPVVKMVGREITSRRTMLAASNYYLRGKEVDAAAMAPPELITVPMVAITGPETAGGGEVIAAALVDNKRAVLLGEATVGVGNSRKLFLISLTRLLTVPTFELYRPNGANLEGPGIKPDVPFAVGEADKLPLPPLTQSRFDIDEPVLQAAIKALKAEK